MGCAATVARWPSRRSACSKAASGSCRAERNFLSAKKPCVAKWAKRACGSSAMTRLVAASPRDSRTRLAFGARQAPITSESSATVAGRAGQYGPGPRGGVRSPAEASSSGEDATPQDAAL